jgi:hypothetical protein
MVRACRFGGVLVTALARVGGIVNGMARLAYQVSLTGVVERKNVKP